jgi:hypothetical protein
VGRSPGGEGGESPVVAAVVADTHALGYFLLMTPLLILALTEFVATAVVPVADGGAAEINPARGSFRVSTIDAQLGHVISAASGV